MARAEQTTSKSSSSPAENNNAAAGSQSEETNETAYEVPKPVRTVQMAPGTIKRLDVALIVDPSYTDKDGKDAALTQQQLDDLGMLVKRAVGFEESASRKDTFQLTAMAFRKEPKAEVPEGAQQQEKRQAIIQIAKHASAVVAVLIFVAFAGLSLRKILRAAPKPASGPAGEKSMAEVDLFGIEGFSGGGNGHAQLRNRVKDVMAKDPEAAARLLQRWIGEDNKGKKAG